MWKKAYNLVATVLLQAGLLLLVCWTERASGAPEPRGPRFGAKPQPGKIEHIHQGSHGEIAYHHDQRVLQGINRDEINVGNRTIDLSRSWKTEDHADGPTRASVDDEGRSVAPYPFGWQSVGGPQSVDNPGKKLGYRKPVKPFLSAAQGRVNPNMCFSAVIAMVTPLMMMFKYWVKS